MVKAAVESRTGREIDVGADQLASEIALIRDVAHSALVQDEVRRWLKDSWPEMAKDKATLSAAIEVLNRIDDVFSNRAWRQEIDATMKLLAHFVERCDSLESDATGRTLRSMFIHPVHGRKFSRGNDHSFNLAQNHRLEMLVGKATELWFHLTGDDMASLKIGHAHHSGPFLRFLIAIDGGEITGFSIRDAWPRTPALIRHRRSIAGMRSTSKRVR